MLHACSLCLSSPVRCYDSYDNSENDDDDDDVNYYDDTHSVQSESGVNDDDLNSLSHPTNSFFRRTESMTFLGCDDPSPFEVSKGFSPVL